MIPDLPDIPSFPQLTWTYADGLYSITEADVDKLLNYGENELPRYRYQMQIYEQSLEVIKEALKEGAINEDAGPEV